MACACWSSEKWGTNNTYPPFGLQLKGRRCSFGSCIKRNTASISSGIVGPGHGKSGRGRWGPRHQTACVDVLGPFQASHLVCWCSVSPVRDVPRHHTACAMCWDYGRLRTAGLKCSSVLITQYLRVGSRPPSGFKLRVLKCWGRLHYQTVFYARALGTGVDNCGRLCKEGLKA